MSKKIVYSILAAMLVLLVAGCGSAARAPAPAMAPYEAASQAEEIMVAEREAVIDEGVYGSPASGSGGADYSDVERLIIRNGSLGVVVSDTEAALDGVNKLVKELGGYIVESNVYKYEEGLQASVVLRVPAESFDVALDRIRELATEVRYENTSGQDVTEEYVDLQSRLRYLEATEARLLEFLEEAEDTEAALAVYEQLRGVQADIEHVKGRMQYLEQSVALATINLEITPDELAQPIQVGGWHPEGTLRDAFQSLIRVLRFLVDAAIVLIVLIIPVLVVIAVPILLLFFLVRRIIRRRRDRRTA
jgi:hypothetical protein